MRLEIFVIFRALAKLRTATISLAMSVCLSAWRNSAATGWIFHEILYLSICRKSVEKIQVLKSDKIMGTSHEDLCTFMVISC
jgi:hypothetical protein